MPGFGDRFAPICLSDVVRFLLDNGADIHAEDEDGMSFGEVSICKATGQRVSQAQRRSTFYSLRKSIVAKPRTALKLATLGKRDDVMKLLLLVEAVASGIVKRCW